MSIYHATMEKQLGQKYLILTLKSDIWPWDVTFDLKIWPWIFYIPSLLIKFGLYINVHVIWPNKTGDIIKTAFSQDKQVNRQ